MSDRVEVGALRLSHRRWEGPSDAAPIVLLHDGLGSITQWRDLPERLVKATGRTVLAYDRAGHGASEPVPLGPHPVDFMHQEATTVLPELLPALGVRRPVLMGHSDGGSIALIRAARAPDTVEAVVALAPHSFVEPECVAAIAALREEPGRLLELLGRHHAHPDAVFGAWSGVWTDPAFAAWDIRPELGAIRCPVSVLQGDADEYATPAMLADTVTAIGPRATGAVLEGCGHAIHRDRPDQLVALIAAFLEGVGQGEGVG